MNKANDIDELVDLVSSFYWAHAKLGLEGADKNPDQILWTHS